MDNNNLERKLVEHVLNGFDFGRVHDVMVHLNWCWVTVNKGEEPPSMYQLVKKAEEMLLIGVKHVYEEEPYYVDCCGFKVTAYGGKLSLEFVLDEFYVYSDEISNDKENKQ